MLGLTKKKTRNEDFLNVLVFHIPGLSHDSMIPLETPLLSIAGFDGYNSTIEDCDHNQKRTIVQFQGKEKLVICLFFISFTGESLKFHDSPQKSVSFDHLFRKLGNHDEGLSASY